MKLKALIYGKGLTQWAIAQRLGWSESRLSRFITGRQVPSDDEFLALSKVLLIFDSKKKIVL